MSPPRKVLNPEEQALNAYITAMFESAPAPLVDAQEPRLKEVARLLAEATEAPIPVLAPKPVPAIVAAPVAIPLVVTAPAIPPAAAVPLVPEWGQGEFQTLFFRVGALTLAVPLSELGGIHPITDKLTPLFGKPDWFMGLQASADGNIQLVDTARWVMPEKLDNTAALPYEYFILLKGTRWGLACTEVHDAVTLRHADVRWRTQLGRRPWLAGVVVEKMCALLDVENFIALIESSAE